MFIGYSRSARRQPDTLILRGVPSRWFAETRVSSKPSMLVTHTIFSALGKIRWVSYFTFLSSSVTYSLVFILFEFNIYMYTCKMLNVD